MQLPRSRYHSRISVTMLWIAVIALLLGGWQTWPRKAKSALPSIPGLKLVDVGPGASTGLSMGERHAELDPNMPRSGPFHIGVGASRKSRVAAGRSSARTPKPQNSVTRHP